MTLSCTRSASFGLISSVTLETGSGAGPQKSESERFLQSHGEPAWRNEQILKGIYKAETGDFFGAPLRTRLCD